MRKYWSEDEIEYLKENWGNVRIETIIRNLNKRTRESIKIKATRLGLGGAKTNGYKYITASQASKMLNVDRHKILKWIYEGKLSAKFMAIAKKQKFWCIDYEYFINWLEKNQHLYDGARIEEYALGYEYEWLIEKRARDKNKREERKFGRNN